MLVVDLETSGLDAERHSIISLGAVDYRNPARTLYLECRMRPGAEFDEEAFMVHGLAKEYLDQQPLSEEQLLQQFYTWASESSFHTIAAQVPQLDWSFLAAGFSRYGMDWPFGHRSLDLHSVCIAHHYFSKIEVPYKYGFPDFGLDKIAQYVGLPQRNGTHNALQDAKITAECFARLLENKTLLPEFEKFPIPKTQRKFGAMYSK